MAAPRARWWSTSCARGWTATHWQITVVDQDDDHLYQPGLLFLPFGGYRPDEIVKPRARFIPDGVDLVLGEIDRVDADANSVRLTDGRELTYDYLVIATGVSPRPDQTPGMLGPQWRRSIFDFYTLDGATALRDALERLRRRPARRPRHRHADQVPGRAAGVHLPRRRVLPCAGACATGSRSSM